jgi:hypothetical protein
MVECQNRGTLHIHLLLWIQGQVNINELQNLLSSDLEFLKKLSDFLDKTIYRDDEFFGPLPDDLPLDNNSSSSYDALINPYFPEFNIFSAVKILKGIKDFQTHIHSPSCYKYSKGIKKCRYRKPEKTYLTTHFNSETGRLNLSKQHPMVNNFNKWILLLTQSNSDIQFLFHGMSSHAIIYYITNYITKSSIGVDNEYAITRAVLEKNKTQPLRSPTKNYTSTQTRAYDLILRFYLSLQSSSQVSALEIYTKLLNLPMAYKSCHYDSLYVFDIFDCFIKYKHSLMYTTNDINTFITDNNGKKFIAPD